MSNSVWIGPFGVRYDGSAYTFPGVVISNGLTLDSTNQDVLLVRDAANIAAFVNGTTAQEFRTYSTKTNASNNRFVALMGNYTGGYPGIFGTGAGTGASSRLYIAGQALYFDGASGVGQWVLDTNNNWVDQGTHTITAGGAITGGTLVSTGKLTSYNGVATAGWGAAVVQASGGATAQVAAVASVATYTVGAADGDFVVSGNVNVTTSTAHNFGIVVTYTDETSTGRSLTLSVAQLTGAIVAAITNVTGAGPYEGVGLQIRAKASTTITITTAGTFTTVVYNVRGSIVQIG